MSHGARHQKGKGVSDDVAFLVFGRFKEEGEGLNPCPACLFKFIATERTQGI
jgi:hypothetical protein